MVATKAPLHVVVLGGGFAGLETAFLLHHRLHDRVRITLVSDRPDFVARPSSIYIPFGGDPSAVSIGLAEPTARRDIAFVESRALDLDPVAKLVALSDRKLAYDKLVIATGAALRPSEIPGLEGAGVTFWSPADMLDLKARLEKTIERARVGRRTRMLFVLPPHNLCVLPLYEMALMIDTHLRRMEVRDKVEITLVTYEWSYLQTYGANVAEVMGGELNRRGIIGMRGHSIAAVTDHTVKLGEGTVLGYEELVSFAPQVAQVRWSSLPCDDRGFLRCTLATRQVEGYPDVYAPGDAGDFPVKQAFMAFLQADAATDHIVSQVVDRPFAKPFDAVTMAVIDELDTATFAQAPLRITGDPLRPTEVDPARPELYKVGRGKSWRMGKKLLSVYLPMRFKAGEPFHAGAAWTMMDVGMKALTGIFAE
ncbi:MAG: FAD-dependent oxidoreductase [Myxococcota bacterium]